MTALRSQRIQIDISRNEVLLDQSPVAIRGKPLRLLYELMSHSGEVLSKAHFNDAVWDGRPHSDAVLTTAIKELRSALGDDSRAPWAIETVHGRGYRFLPEVVEGQAVPTDVHAEEGPRLARNIAIFAFLLLAAVSLYFVVSQKAATPIESIAVLPFDDLSPSGDLSWFAHGMTEELLNSLVRIDGLDVSARTSATRMANRGATIGEIGDALRVSHIIEGSVRSDGGDTIRITAQLIRVHDEFHVWSSTWHRSATPASTLEIQTEVAERIIGLMEPSSTTTSQQSMSTALLPDSAWEKLLRGRELVERRAPESLVAGIALLQEVTREFPENAPSHAALASAYIYAGEANVIDARAAMTSASSHAEQAMELDSNSSTALLAASLIAIVRGDPKMSLELADRAISINPSMAQAYQRRGVALIALGEVEASRLALRQAVIHDPLSPVALAQSGQASLRAGLVDDAYEAAKENLRWNPQSQLASAFMAELSVQIGDYERALGCLKTSGTDKTVHSFPATLLGEMLWRIGSFEQLTGLREIAPAAYAAGLVSQGRSAEAARQANAIQHSGLVGVTALDILVWIGDYERARHFAEQVFLKLGDFAMVESQYPLPDNALLAYRVLSSLKHPDVERMAQLLDDRYAYAVATDAKLFSELYAGLSWHVLNEDMPQAMSWLRAAQQNGVILPELEVDPLFKSLREEPQASGILALMEQRAAQLRADLDGMVSCQ